MDPPGYSTLCGIDEFSELPSYSPSLHKYDLVLYKRELKSPSVPINEWSWHLAILELNSTQLNFYKVNELDKINKLLKKCIEFKSKIVKKINEKDSKFLSDAKFQSNDLLKYLINNENSKDSIPNELIMPYIGDRIISFTLQYAKIGIAKDIHKRKNVYRIRLELEQFLIGFMNKKRFLHFHSDFKIARCISMLVEDRIIKDKELSTIDTLLRFNGWKGMVCLPWDEGCEKRFSSLKRYEKLFFYFDEAINLKRRQKGNGEVLKYKKFVIRDCGIEEYV